MKPFEHVVVAAVSDIGLKREKNEDSWDMLPEHGILVVADGMGGGDEGEVASKAVANAIRRTFESFPPGINPLSMDAKIRAIRAASNQACRWIRRRMREVGTRNSGSTAIVVMFAAETPNQARVLHAGDSRAYRYRNGRLARLTRDHSAGAAIGIEDDAALPPMLRGVVTRAIGIQESVDMEEGTFDVLEGDAVLVCSDGLSRMVSDREITRLIKKHAPKGAEACAEALKNQALEHGGKDNVTIVLALIGRIPSPSPVEDLSFPGESEAGTTDHDTSKTSEAEAEASTENGGDR